MEGSRSDYYRSRRGHPRGRGRGYHHHHPRGRGQGHGQYPRHSYQYDGGQRSDAVQAEVDALFQKSFTFEKVETDEAGNLEWSLLSIADDHSTSSQDDKADSQKSREDWNDTLSDLRSKLRSVQSHLSDKEIQEWHSHTASTHRGGLVVVELRKRFHIELGTQAWCKFHEILACKKLIPELPFNSESLHSIHICEAPGAFVCSLNHHLKTHRDTESIIWKWLATSLNPHYEGNTIQCTIVDDRLILQTPDCWYFGEDNTGNIMSLENLRGLEKLVETQMEGTVHLVTADGSVNCQDDPCHQEQRVFPLLYCQALTAVQLLVPGGSFVIKMFTMYSPNTASLMYILNCAFKEVTVVKPVCSKAGNSEVYVVCKIFRGREHLGPRLAALLQHFGPDVGNSLLFNPSDLPPSFVTQLEHCSRKFTEYQLNAIEENLELYKNIDSNKRRHINNVRYQCVEMYIRRCHLRSIKRHLKLMQNFPTKSSSMFAKNLHHRLQGSLDEREEAQQRSWEDQLRGILAGVQDGGSSHTPRGGSEAPRGASHTPRGATANPWGNPPGVVKEKRDSFTQGSGDCSSGYHDDSSRSGTVSPSSMSSTSASSSKRYCFSSRDDDDPVRFSPDQEGHGGPPRLDPEQTYLVEKHLNEQAISPRRNTDFASNDGTSLVITHAAVSPESSADLSLSKIKQVIPAMRVAEPGTPNGTGVHVDVARSPCQGSSDHGQRSSGEGDAVCLDGHCCEGVKTSTRETDQVRGSDVLTQAMPMINWESSGSHPPTKWNIVMGRPPREVFMSPFCETDLFEQWRKVRMQAQVLEKHRSDSSGAVSGRNLSTLACGAIRDILSRRVEKGKCKVKGQEWACLGFTAEEEGSLSQLASSLDASIMTDMGSSQDTETLLDQIQMLQQSGEEKQIGSLFVRLPSWLAGCGNEPGSAELATKPHFIAACLLVQHVLQTGGSFHLLVPSLFTRFSVCLIYVLCLTFDLVTLIGCSSDDLGIPSIMISCVGYHPNQQLNQYIQRVHDEMMELQPGGSHDVLQFIPMINLYNPDFDRALSSFVEQSVREDLMRVVAVELASLQGKAEENQSQ